MKINKAIAPVYRSIKILLRSLFGCESFYGKGQITVLSSTANRIASTRKVDRLALFWMPAERGSNIYVTNKRYTLASFVRPLLETQSPFCFFPYCFPEQLHKLFFRIDRLELKATRSVQSNTWSILENHSV
jgi:hypothetical protein